MRLPRRRDRPHHGGVGRVSLRKAVAETLPLLVRPRSAWLHLRWHMKSAKHRRIREDIREHFDDAFYVRSYPEVRRYRIGPLRHYILCGWREGKDPSELFSTAAYLEMYQDVKEMNVNPFQHYLTHGRQEGRVARVSAARRRRLMRPQRALEPPPAVDPAEWDLLPRRVVDPPTAPAVDVVVPVYKSLPHVAATLRSVLSARCETPFECLVIDDASPEPEVKALLSRLAASGHIRLLVNDANLGFVRSVNRGMAHNPDRDVVLLNADTLVHDGWLDRLVAPFTDDPAIATVTPFSNNATIASYPNTAVDNAYELEATSEVLDRLAARANGRRVVDVPTGIGFCMAIRRAALAALGPFDAETFGIGYGEENDFCMRALKSGWRNVVAPGVYVRHYGSTSFGPGHETLRSEAQGRLAAKHPDYAGRITRHIKADPLLPSRILLDVARMREAFGPVSILFFTHTRGGGIETFLDNARRTLLANGLGHVTRRAVVVQTMAQGFVQIVPFDRRRMPYLPNLEALNIERHKDLLGEIFDLLDPDLVHVNSFAGLSVPSIDRLMEALARAKRPYWHVWHDHQPLCPRLTFLDSEERYCGETDATRCGPCLGSSHANHEWVRIEDWRERFRTYLAGAEVVSAPSEAAALRARRLVDAAKVVVDPHPEPELDGVEPMDRPERADGTRHVLILGAIGPHKGAYLLHAMIGDAQARGLPLHFHVVGYTCLKEIVTGPHVTVHGRYHGDGDAVKKVRAVAPDVALSTSIWPETYLFTLSVPFALGIPTVAFGLGAQGERVGAYGRGRVLDAHLMEDPVGLNDAVLALDLDTLWRAPAAVDFARTCALSVWFRRRAGTRQGLNRGPARATEPRPEDVRLGEAGTMSALP